MTATDEATLLSEAVRAAVARKESLNITGNGSKPSHRRPAPSLSVAAHRGVIDYAPTELVITARAGTLIAELEEALEEKGQILPFEPPRLAGQATLGGTLADATAGPGGGYLGATKDFVLGLSMINGRAETLRFGGTVMKNVAGYDISRLMVGSRGELGVILQASIKVLPRVKKTVTLNFDFSYVEAILFLESIATQPHPITASSLHNGVLSLRLSGGEAAVEAARRQLGGEPADNALWEELREWNHPFFQTTLPIWQLSLPFPPSLPPAEAHLFEWGGRRCWLASSASPDSIHQQAGDWGGYARLFRSDGEMDEDISSPLPPAMTALRQRIKRAFDPDGVFSNQLS